MSSEQLISDTELNRMLKEGWALVGFAHDSQVYTYIFYKWQGLLKIEQSQPFIETEQGKLIITQSPVQAEPVKRFMFKNALISLGVSPQLAADWIKVRQAKKAAQTETAFNIIAKQIKLGMDAYGVSADDIVRVAVDRNWQGLKVEWLDNVDWAFYGIQVGKNDLPFGNQNWE